MIRRWRAAGCRPYFRTILPGSQRTHASPCQGRWLFVWAKSRRGRLSASRGRSMRESRYDCHRQSLRLKIRCALQHAPTMVSYHFHRTLVGDGALDVPFWMPSMPVHECRGGYQPPVSCDYDPALAGGRLPPLPIHASLKKSLFGRTEEGLFITRDCS
jgi:hypothetical protein